MNNFHEMAESTSGREHDSELRKAENVLAKLSESVGNDSVKTDEVVSELVHDIGQGLQATAESKVVAAETGMLEVWHYAGAVKTKRELNVLSLESISAAMIALEAGKGEDAAKIVMHRLDAAYHDNGESQLAEEIDSLSEKHTPSGLRVEFSQEIKPADNVDMPQSNGGRERYALEHTADQWRIDTLGTAETESIFNDLDARLSIPDHDRQGEVLIDLETGAERRPIMDISMDEMTRQHVANKVSERSAQLRRTLVELEELSAGSDTATEKFEKAEKIMEKARVNGGWEEMFKNGIAGSDSGPGTLADLYINPEDVACYDAVDAIMNQMVPEGWRAIDSRTEMHGRLLSLAATMFPEGTELVHVTTVDALKRIRRHGSLSPRLEFMYGQDVNQTSVNGNFIHMTEPGTAALEYGGVTPVVLGIPIETIMEHSSILQFEPSYVGNQHSNPAEAYDEYGPAGSIQQAMGKFTINRPRDDAMPEVFARRISTLHDKLDREGYEAALIGQGAFNNFGFAASSNADNAGRYSYPLEELTIHTDGDHAKPKNFHFSNEPLVAYAPITTQRVPFTENSISGYRPKPSLENTLEEAMPMYVGEILAGSSSQDEVLARVSESIDMQPDGAGLVSAFDSLNNKKYGDLQKIDLLRRVSPRSVLRAASFLGSESDDVKFEAIQKLRESESMRWLELPWVKEVYVPTEFEESMLAREQQAERMREEAETATRSTSSIADLSF